MDVHTLNHIGLLFLHSAQNLLKISFITTSTPVAKLGHEKGTVASVELCGQMGLDGWHSSTATLHNAHNPRGTRAKEPEKWILLMMLEDSKN